jgi:hypothetical protein
MQHWHSLRFTTSVFWLEIPLTKSQTRWGDPVFDFSESSVSMGGCWGANRFQMRRQLNKFYDQLQRLF